MIKIVTQEEIEVNRKYLLDYLSKINGDKIESLSEIEPWALKEHCFEDTLEHMLFWLKNELTSCGISKEKANELYDGKEIKFHYKKDEKIRFVMEFDKEELVNLLK